MKEKKDRRKQQYKTKKKNEGKESKMEIIKMRRRNQKED